MTKYFSLYSMAILRIQIENIIRLKTEKIDEVRYILNLICAVILAFKTRNVKKKDVQ